MKNTLLFIFALTLLPLFGQAEDKKLTPAEDLIKVMRMEETVIEGGEAGFPMVAQSLVAEDLTKEEMTEVKDAFMVYMTQLARDPELKVKTIEIYNKNFTEDELIELTAFYRTPVGQKALTTLSAVTGEILVLSQKLSQRHVGVFQEALTDILTRKAAREKKENE